MTAKAPPVLWVVLDKDGRVCETWLTRAPNDAAHNDEINPSGYPHRVVAYVPRDTP